MLVVSDASPINVLIRISLVELLPRLFGKVIIPTAVAQELSHLSTPKIVHDWLSNKPEWLETRDPSDSESSAQPRHRGEREAIKLALELKADLLLVDELRPRRIALSHGISVIGTIGILERAALEGLIDLDMAFTKLRLTDFYVSDNLLIEVAKRYHQRAAALNEVKAQRPDQRLDE